VRVLKLDVTDEASVSAWADEVASLVPHVDLCVVNHGIYAGRGLGLLDLTAADFDVTFRTNVTGAFLVVQALARRGLIGASPKEKPEARPFPREPLLGSAADGQAPPGALPALRADEDGGTTSVLALMSSILGSHGDPVVSAVSPGSHAYRASKAGLNMIGHAFCVGLAPKGVATTTLHPSYVKGTGMTGDAGWVTIDESVDGLEALLTGQGRGEAPRPLHGRWWHAGTLEEIPW
jgi:NAD(P)-dependent dehydrogenase (short-subunit alcohol dehydrogenase family)